MNADAPEWLRKQIRAHNRHALWLSLLSLGAAGLAWSLGYFFLVLILSGAETSVNADFEPRMPPWISACAFAIAAALLTWGIIDHFRSRFAGASDRPVIGWHLFGDFLLLPVRLTFAVWGNFSAIRWLNSTELARAWELLAVIQKEGRSRLSSLTLIEPDFDRLYRLLSTLQMLDLIDLHRGERDWFYTVRSTHLEELRARLTN